MSVSSIKPWTVDEFFAWGATQEGRYEFDGVRPVAMTGGSANHSQIVDNIKFALRSRLRGTPCAAFGPELAISTIGARVRYPDTLVTCTKFPGTDRIAPDPIVIFEVLSPESGRRDRIEKLREYAAVPSVRHYVIVESSSIGLTSFCRTDGNRHFESLPLTESDVLSLDGIEIEIPVLELYEGIEFDPGVEPAG